MNHNKITNEFIESFWKWFKEYHEERYRKEGKELTPSFQFHSKHMKFDSPHWDWVAIFINERYKQKALKVYRKNWLEGNCITCGKKCTTESTRCRDCYRGYVKDERRELK
jgi:hypothetical protein